MGNDNIEFGDIVDLVRGHLKPERRSRIEARIRADSVLQRLVELLMLLRSEAVSGDWKSLKPAVHALLDRQLRERRHKVTEKSATRGVTVFDSRLLPLPEGVRPALVDTGHIRYRIDAEYLELSLYPVSVNSFEIIGRFTGGAEESFAVRLHRETKQYTSDTNEFGLFRFPRVSRGHYVLEVLRGSAVIGTVDCDV